MPGHPWYRTRERRRRRSKKHVCLCWTLDSVCGAVCGFGFERARGRGRGWAWQLHDELRLGWSDRSSWCEIDSEVSCSSCRVQQSDRNPHSASNPQFAIRTQIRTLTLIYLNLNPNLNLNLKTLIFNLNHNLNPSPLLLLFVVADIGLVVATTSLDTKDATSLHHYMCHFWVPIYASLQLRRYE